MRLILSIVLCGALAGVATAQRGGGSRGSGGFPGGHSGSAGVSRGFSGGSYRGGSIGGSSGYRGGGGAGYSGYRGGNGAIGYSGYRGGYGYGRSQYGYGGYAGYGRYGNRGFGWGYGGFYPGWGLGFGLGYWPSYWPGYGDYGYEYYDPYYSSPPSPTVVYQPSAPAPSQTVYVERPAPPAGARGYDEYGQQLRPSTNAPPAPPASSSPLYLIAFNDQTIQAATSYRLDGDTLIYVNLQHEEKRAPLSSLDRDLTTQLNRDRHVEFRLPAR